MHYWWEGKKVQLQRKTGLCFFHGGNTELPMTQQLHFRIHTWEKTRVHTEACYRDAHNRRALID